MRLSWLLSLPAVLSVTSAMAIERRDADFFSVRTTMHKDMSGKRGDPKGKYFREFESEFVCCLLLACAAGIVVHAKILNKERKPMLTDFS